jgi:hypothetical protein
MPELLPGDVCVYEFLWRTPAACPVNGRPEQPQQDDSCTVLVPGTDYRYCHRRIETVRYGTQNCWRTLDPFRSDELSETPSLSGLLGRAKSYSWVIEVRDPTEQMSPTRHLKMATDLVFAAVENSGHWTKSTVPVMLMILQWLWACMHLQLTSSLILSAGSTCAPCGTKSKRCLTWMDIRTRLLHVATSPAVAVATIVLVSYWATTAAGIAGDVHLDSAHSLHKW